MSKKRQAIEETFIPLNVRVPKELARAIKRVAFEREVRVQDVAREAFEKYLKNEARA